jgi:predicted enzyme related to lactoylglutathione lyase
VNRGIRYEQSGPEEGTIRSAPEYDLPGGGCLALTNFIPDKPSDAAGGTIAFEVEDLDKLVADLKAKNVIFRGDIIHTPVCRMAVCLDSEGNSLLLHQLNPK